MWKSPPAVLVQRGSCCPQGDNGAYKPQGWLSACPRAQGWRWRRDTGLAREGVSHHSGLSDTGARDAGSISDHFIATVAVGQTQLPEGVWVQPLDPSNTVEKMNLEPPSIFHPSHHGAALGHHSHPAACTSGSWRPAGKSEVRPKVQSVPILELQGLPPRPALGLLAVGSPLKPPCQAPAPGPVPASDHH